MCVSVCLSVCICVLNKYYYIQHTLDIIDTAVAAAAASKQLELTNFRQNTFVLGGRTRVKATCFKLLLLQAAHASVVSNYLHKHFKCTPNAYNML